MDQLISPQLVYSADRSTHMLGLMVIVQQLLGTIGIQSDIR